MATQPPPRLQAVAAAYAPELADLASDIRHGRSCLVTCDKALTPFLYVALRDRLKALDLASVYVDGRPRTAEAVRSDAGVVAAMLDQLRQILRGAAEVWVVIVPHLDVLSAEIGGLSPEAREVIPLLYDDPERVLLGFRDPTLPLLPVVAKRFTKVYVLDPRPIPLPPTEPETAPPADGPTVVDSPRAEIEEPIPGLEPGPSDDHDTPPEPTEAAQDAGAIGAGPEGLEGPPP